MSNLKHIVVVNDKSYLTKAYGDYPKTSFKNFAHGFDSEKLAKEAIKESKNRLLSGFNNNDEYRIEITDKDKDRLDFCTSKKGH